MFKSKLWGIWGYTRPWQGLSEEAEERYNADGEPTIKPDLRIWDCEGWNMECSKNLKLLSFAGVSDVKMMKWLLNLILMLPVCNTMGCGGDSMRLL